MSRVVLVTGLQASGKSTVGTTSGDQARTTRHVLRRRRSSSAAWMDRLEGFERHLVVLNPSIAALAAREIGRGGRNSYRDWQSDGDSLEDAIGLLAKGLDGIPRRGLWLDSSELTAEETVEAILEDGLASSRW